LNYRDLKREVVSRNLPATDLDTSALRNSLVDLLGEPPRPQFHPNSWTRSPESGGDLEATATALVSLAEEGNWKKALRKLKQLKTAVSISNGSSSPDESTQQISEDVYGSILVSLASCRLQGGLSAEATRKVMEEVSRSK